MSYEIKTTDAETARDTVGKIKKGKMKYPILELKEGQHFDVPQKNGRPSIDSIRVTCSHYQGLAPEGCKFTYDYVSAPDKNGDKIIRVWCEKTEG